MGREENGRESTHHSRAPKLERQPKTMEGKVAKCGQPETEATTPLKELQEVLIIDKNHRYEGVRCDLYSLEDLKCKKWDDPLPTWVHGDQMSSYAPNTVFHNSITMRQFSDTLYEMFPLLRGIAWENTLLAGGSIQRVLQRLTRAWLEVTGKIESAPKEYVPVTDTDLFLYGLSEEAGLKKVEALAREIRDEATSRGYNVRYVRSGQAMSIMAYNPKSKRPNYPVAMVQIIFRIYAAPSEILHGFDLGCAAVGWTGMNLYFTSLGKFAYEYGLNVFDNSRRSTTYEVRVSKYMERGFGFVVPKWKEENDKILLHGSRRYIPNSFLRVTILEKCGKRMRVILDPMGQSQSDYGLSTDLSGRRMAQNNLTRLMQNRADAFIYAGEELEGVLMGRFAIDEKQLDRLYNRAKAKLTGKIIRNSDYSVFRYILTASHLEVLAHREETGYLDALMAREKENIRQMTRCASAQPMPIKMRTSNPGTQLNGSFNPVFEREEQWYGSMYAGEKEAK